MFIGSFSVLTWGFRRTSCDENHKVPGRRVVFTSIGDVNMSLISRKSA
jgi:hypothetical protein